jgi:acetoin utilization deacetylase AcuC-like enzyme
MGDTVCGSPRTLLAFNQAHEQHNGRMSEWAGRIAACKGKLEETKLLECVSLMDSIEIPAAEVLVRETSFLAMVHPDSHFQMLKDLPQQLLASFWNCSTCTMQNEATADSCHICGCASKHKKKGYVIPPDRTDLYLCVGSLVAAYDACATFVRLAQSVWAQHATNGFAVIRPPGHHACTERAGSFCLINNVAAAAKALLSATDGPKRVLIVDWDVHHGDGTQEIVGRDPLLLEGSLFVSIHRHSGMVGGKLEQFWPITGKVGEGTANVVNLPLPGVGYGDADYLYLFHTVVLPLAQEFAPEIVLVSTVI